MTNCGACCRTDSELVSIRDIREPGSDAVVCRECDQTDTILRIIIPPTTERVDDPSPSER